MNPNAPLTGNDEEAPCGKAQAQAAAMNQKCAWIAGCPSPATGVRPQPDVFDAER